eukprot:CAMPEP_0170523038 /NCGR_PEP_ID=MMETSP0209-20121228/8436_1 /TAXON_ID=665100 ORGANISM="Litonotus pictus, Strain P1" /NCGR_SAMPLE_ID=MMETSP0209 /ASSEMBLY_ACC=CAM_ASM_000301 /LENGTH=161 /DNA_ID=CAMNT_0010810867 /DNA_START=572 /DNA_END=1054 /DNA_ORIENTATION=+
MISSSKYINRLKWYPISQCICFLPLAVNKLIGMVWGHTYFAPLLLQEVGSSLRGLIFASVFGFSSQIKNNIVSNIKNFIIREEDPIEKEIKTQLDRLDTLSECPEDDMKSKGGPGIEMKDVLCKKQKESIISNHSKMSTSIQGKSYDEDKRDSIISIGSDV